MTQHSVIVYLQNIKKTFTISYDLLEKYSLFQIINIKLGFPSNSFYLINKTNNKHLSKNIVINNTTQTTFINNVTPNIIILDIFFREKGGFILDMISDFFEMILYPAVYPFKGILQAFLMLIKAIVYMIALLIYAIKVIVWFFADFLPAIPGDIIAFIQYFTNIFFDVLLGTTMYYVKIIVNKLGRMTVKSTMGWDNVPDETNKDDANSDYFNNKCSDKKCYKTADGTVPFSVIIATILCPPVGVFMEYGITGWINILICAILTLMFYFPGLIYALILLYC